MANQSTFAAPQKADNWRAVAGNKLPDGTTDVLEGIYHDGAVHLGNSNIDGALGNTRFKHLGIASYTGNGNFTSQVLQTNIPKNSTIMPSIDLRGYAYDGGNTVDVQIGLYTYLSGQILSSVWQSKGTTKPLLIRAGWNSANLLALEITWSASDDYFNRYGVDAYCDGNGGGQRDSWFENWAITNSVFDASFTQVITITAKDMPVALPFATPAQTIAGTSTTTIVNPADLYARENIPAQTGLSNNVTAIPAPTASQSVWGVNLLGETLHYAPGLGWQIVKPLAVINIGSVQGVGPHFAPAGTYSNIAVFQTLDGPSTTITNTTSRKQLITFTLHNEALWYAPFSGDVVISYQMLINGVATNFSGTSRIPPFLVNNVDNRNMTGVINYELPANSSATFALREFMREGNGGTVVVPANTLLVDGGFVTYVQHSV